MRAATLLPYQPDTMTTAQLAAVSFLARYGGSTHVSYSAQLKRWFDWCASNGLDPLDGIKRPISTSTSETWPNRDSWQRR